MASIEKSNEVSDEVRVKNEPICDSQSISETKVLAMKVKEEPIDIDIQTNKSHIESTSLKIEVKSEEKFSTIEELANVVSIAFLNEETTDNRQITNTIQLTTSNSQTKKQNNKKSR